MSTKKNSKKIKWCFLVALCPDVMESFAKLAEQILKEGDECFLIVSNKIAEYSKLEYFPKNIKFFSAVDWCKENYQEKKEGPKGFSWKEVFPAFSRSKLYQENYQDWIRTVNQIYQFVDFVLQKEKPDIVLHEIPGGIFPKITFLLCQKYNITYLGLVNSRFPGRMDVRDLECKSSISEEAFKKLNENNISGEEKKFAKAFIENFVSHRELPTYMDYQMDQIKGFFPKKYFKEQLTMAKHWFRYLLKRNDFCYFDHESERRFKYWFRYPTKALRWRIKGLFSKKVFDPINENDKFFLFPLHIQPEYSTSLFAPYFNDQLNTITNIAFSLPFPYKLYVKEHPLAFEGRSKEFYKEIKRIPNVVFVSPEEKIEPLIKKSEGVITISSTVGLEAVLIGKLVYAFGDECFYYHPLCRRVNSFEELKQKIEQDLKNKPVVSDSESVNIRFVISYFKSTIPVNLFAAASDNDSNNYKVIYEDIKKTFL